MASANILFSGFVLPLCQAPPEDVEGSKMEKSEEVRPEKDVEYKTMKDVEEPAKDIKHKRTKDVEEPVKDVEHETMIDEEELKLGKDIEEMKSKLRELKVKLIQVSFLRGLCFATKSCSNRVAFLVCLFVGCKWVYEIFKFISMTVYIDRF